uniref:Uncharacterized protein n=1 Tax=Arundo donax TaxID=35708 RepID=A0A0A9E1V7_ARUDO
MLQTPDFSLNHDQENFLKWEVCFSFALLRLSCFHSDKYRIS